jgi:uncharacterized protein
MNEKKLTELRVYAESVFRCNPHSIHGPAHWRNVEDTVIFIASETGADVVVGRLFAIFHDCCRLNDGSDWAHGPRAADLLRRIAGSRFTLDVARLDLLLHAVSHHTDGTISDDPTIGACWDADRLDLGRVGITPDEILMSTQPGKEISRLIMKELYMKER